MALGGIRVKQILNKMLRRKKRDKMMMGDLGLLGAKETKRKNGRRKGKKILMLGSSWEVKKGKMQLRLLLDLMKFRNSTICWRIFIYPKCKDDQNDA